MFDFRKTAKESTMLSELMNGRSQISTNDIIKFYPNGITICGVDRVKVAGNEYAVCVFSEDNTKFFNAGKILTGICFDWLKAFEDDVKKCNDELMASGGVKIKMSIDRTKDGSRNITKVDVL